MKKTISIAALVGVGILTLSGCGQAGTPPQAGTTDTTAVAPAYEVDENADFAGSTTWQSAHDTGNLTIGVRFDQPGLGYKPAGADEPAGFDIEIAKLVAAHLGFSPDQIDWIETVSANREPFLQNGTVDLVVATYTINDQRKKVVDFAGPYYIAGQDLLVAEDSDITGPEDLAGRTVCSVDGSTPAQRITQEFPGTDLVTYDVYSKCVTDLLSGSVEAVTTDDTVLRGYAAQNNGVLRVVGAPFSEEPYGVGLPLGDDVLRSAINDAFDDAREDGTWEEAFTFTLGDASSVTQPPVDRY